MSTIWSFRKFLILVVGVVVAISFVGSLPAQGASERDVTISADQPAESFFDFWQRQPESTNGTITFSIPFDEDVYVDANRSNVNFAGTSPLKIFEYTASGALFRVDPAKVPTYGNMPISSLGMAVYVTRSWPEVPVVFSVISPCRPWTESTATWNNAGCTANSATMDVITGSGPGWETFGFAAQNLQTSVSPSGYYLFNFAGGIGNVKELAAIESGPDTAPRLLVSYQKDEQAPQLLLYGGGEPPTETEYRIAEQGIPLFMQDDIGVHSLAMQLSYDNGLTWGTSTTVADYGCRFMRDELYRGTPYVGTVPPGVRVIPRFQMEDCAGNVSNWLQLSPMVIVTGCEQYMVKQLDDMFMPIGTTVQRAADWANPYLPAGVVQNIYGGTGTVCYLSEEARFNVDAPGYDTNIDTLFAFDQGFNPPTHVIHVPWYGTQAVGPEQFLLRAGGPVEEIMVTVPRGEKSVAGFLFKPERPNACCSLLIVEAWAGDELLDSWSLSTGYVDVWNYRHVDLSALQGRTISLRFRVTHDSVPDWGMTVKRVVVSAQNPEIWVQPRSIFLQTDVPSAVEAPITVTLETTVGGYVTATTSTSYLTATMPVTLTLDNATPPFTAMVEQGDQHLYTWEITRIVPIASQTITYTVQVDTPGRFSSLWTLSNDADPYLENNTSIQYIHLTPNIFFLPYIAR